MNNSNNRNRNQNQNRNRTSDRNSSSRNATGKNTVSRNSSSRNAAGTSTSSRNSAARNSDYKNASRSVSNNLSRGTNWPSNQSTNRSRVNRSKRRRKNSIFIKILIVILEAIQVINERIKERLHNATFNDKVVYALIILLLVLFGGSMFSVLGQKSTITDVTQDFNAGAKTYTGVQQQSANQSEANNYTTQFANTCFIGDARVESLAANVQLPSTTFLTQGDLRIKDATANSAVVSGLQAKSFGRIYIELGINDVASYSESEIVAGYTNLVNLIRNYQPDAKIYLLSVIPVTKQFNDANGNIILTTIEKINTNIQQVANKNNVNYVDIVPDICGTADRVLPTTATTDGKLLNQQYCNKWLGALSK